MIHDTQTAQISQKQDEHDIYVIIKIYVSLVPVMCNRTSCAQVHELPQSHRGDSREATLFFHDIYVLLATISFDLPLIFN